MENGQLMTRVKIGKARASYVSVFHPKGVEGAEPKYSISLIIPKENKALIAQIEQAIKNAFDYGKTTLGANAKLERLKTPLRDGDEERPDDEAYKGAYFINASCKTKPGVSVFKGTKVVDGKKQNIIENLEDEEEMYSGCYVYASVNFYAFNQKGNKGIAAGLNNVLKVADGEPLGGRSSAEAEFSDMEIDEELPATNDDDMF